MTFNDKRRIRVGAGHCCPPSSSSFFIPSSIVPSSILSVTPPTFTVVRTQGGRVRRPGLRPHTAPRLHSVVEFPGTPRARPCTPFRVFPRTSTLGVECCALNARCSMFGVRCSVFDVRCSMFIVPSLPSSSLVLPFPRCHPLFLFISSSLHLFIRSIGLPSAFDVQRSTFVFSSSFFICAICEICGSMRWALGIPPPPFFRSLVVTLFPLPLHSSFPLLRVPSCPSSLRVEATLSETGGNR